jgi:flagellar assembly factor FliW
MDVTTTRFGTISAQQEDLLHFEGGLIGLEHCRSWILLSDGQNGSLGWLQNIDRVEVAVGIVSPRLFVPDYQLRVASNELKGLQLAELPVDDLPESSAKDVQVVVIVSRQPEGLSLNLKAPLVINVETRLGCQVVSRDDYPVRHLLPVPGNQSMNSELGKTELRKIA